MPSLTFSGSQPAPGPGPAGLAWDGHTLWCADYASARIYGLDLATQAITTTLLCPGSLSGLAFDGRALWQVLHMDGWLRQMNRETHDIDRTIPIPDHGWLAGATWDGRHLWVVSQQRGELLAVERESGKVVRRLSVPQAGGGLAYGHAALWLAVPDRMVFDARQESFTWAGAVPAFLLLQLDPATGQEVARYSLDFLPMGLEWVGDTLWLSQMNAGRLFQATFAPGD